MKKFLATTLFAIFASAIAVQPSIAETIDVLVLYDNELDDHYDGSPQTALLNMVATGNRYFADSNIDIQLNMVGPIKLELGNRNESLNDLKDNADVQRLRESLHADIVTYVSGSHDFSEGFQDVAEANMFNIVIREDMTRSFAHEIGHNLGLAHSLRAGNQGRAYAYGRGYGIENEMSTMMAYLSHYDSPRRTFRFSNPDYECAGYTCGIENEADAARAANLIKSDIAGHRAAGRFISMRKRNIRRYAVDAGNYYANGRQAYLFGYNSNNRNQHFEQIDRGNDYFQLRKRNTNHCLDGGNGGENGQAVYLWECGDNNHNQHWKKVHLGEVSDLKYYRLEKRNAPGFSIDGGNGGADRQKLYLWGSDNGNQNQHWVFARES